MTRFGKILALRGNFCKSFSIFEGLFSIWKIANLLWQILCAIGQNFVVVKSQILKE